MRVKSKPDDFWSRRITEEHRWVYAFRPTHY
ncbi:type II toxin-antitoxin system YoeB family toxin [Martelella alba]